MHIHARGHEVEPCNSHFFMSKNKYRNKTREKGAAGEQESHAHRCKRSQAEPRLPFFMCKNRKRNKTTDFTCNIIGRYGTISSFFV